MISAGAGSSPRRPKSSTGRPSASSARRVPAFQDGGNVVPADAARFHQHGEVIEKVGYLLDTALFIAGRAGEHHFHRFLADLLRNSHRAGLEELRRIGACPHLARTASHDPCQLRSEEHTSELQSLMRISYAVFCLQKKNN